MSESEPNRVEPLMDEILDSIFPPNDSPSRLAEVLPLGLSADEVASIVNETKKRRAPVEYILHDLMNSAFSKRDIITLGSLAIECERHPLNMGARRSRRVIESRMDILAADH